MPRPRSVRAHQKVLDAALRLIANSGVDGTSMDAIAEESGVSKATIYKHWPDKDRLILEALVRAYCGDDIPEFNSGDIRRDLVDFLEYRASEHPAQDEKRNMHFMAYAARNPGFRMAWKDRVLEPPRTRLREILERGVKQGELPADLNIDMSIALLLGPMMYRVAAGSAIARAPADMPAQVVESFWRAWGRTRRKR